MAIFRSLLTLILHSASPFLLLILAATPALAADDGRYLAQLTEKAASLDLPAKRNWQILLHYKKTVTGGYKSRISDPDFFLSPEGRREPGKELQATLAAFLQPVSGDENRHAICRFPARFQWLKEELGIDPSQLPAVSCAEQQKLIEAVDARSAVLVFPVGHINSPASMFGHTLLRIDGSSRSNLVSYAVNYAANATDANGFIYAYKGIFGGYKGYYSLMPYYLKVKEYGDLEHRDMWEYRLKLSQEEVRRMLLHALELEKISSEYYFLDENCSFNLLYLIEAGRPALHLTDRTGMLVLPTNTIEIAREEGILEEAVYRPSQGARIVKMASLLDDTRQQAALDIARGKIEPKGVREPGNSETERREILDLAAETLQLRFARKEIDQDAYTKLYLKILSERSSLGKGDEERYAVDPPTPPDAGHRTTKAGVGGGVRRGEWYGEIHLQPEFHSLLDPDQGYLRGAQIKFFDTKLTYFPEQERLQLKTLHLLDIVSTAPRDRFFKPYSWKVVTGWDREPMRDGRDSLIYRLNTGGGFTARSPGNGIIYAFGEMDVNAGKRLRGDVAAGPGATLGALEQLTDWWKLQLQGSAYSYLLGDDRVELKGTLAQNFRLAQNSSLSLDCTVSRSNGHSIPDIEILWNHYF